MIPTQRLVANLTAQVSHFPKYENICLTHPYCNEYSGKVLSHFYFLIRKYTQSSKEWLQTSGAHAKTHMHTNNYGTRAKHSIQNTFQLQSKQFKLKKKYKLPSVILENSITPLKWLACTFVHKSAGRKACIIRTWNDTDWARATEGNVRPHMLEPEPNELAHRWDSGGWLGERDAAKGGQFVLATFLRRTDNILTRVLVTPEQLTM